MDFNEKATAAVNKGKELANAAWKATTPPKSQWEDWKSQGVERRLDSKYNVNQYMYPNDLMSDDYGGNYAVFYINVSVESRLAVTADTVELDPKTEKRFRGGLVARSMEVGGLVDDYVKTGLADGLGGMYKKFTGGSGKTTTSNENSNQVEVNPAPVMGPDYTRSQKRLKTAIALHIPNQLNVRYGTQWSEESTAGLQGAADAIKAGLGGKGVEGKLAALGQLGREGVTAIGLNKGPAGLSAALGIASNPKQEQTFKGVDFRTFTFEYQFFPRSSDESHNVLRIIDMFKLHMHPEFKSQLNYVWIYPSEFDIIYYNKHVENRSIHRHTSCVLTELSVNYTPNGVYSVFPDGVPTQINLSMSFKELQILSKETIYGGM